MTGFQSTTFVYELKTEQFCPWNSGKNTGVGSHSLLQGIFLMQGLDPGLLHCRQILYQLSLQGSQIRSSCRCCSVTQSCPTLCDSTDCRRPGFLVLHHLWSLLKLMSTESVIPSNHLILCHPLLFLPSIFPSIRVFSNESTLHIRWPKYWSFHISPSNEYSGLISFRIGWFDLLAVQGTLKSLLQHHSSKASILWCSAFFMVQLSHPYMTTGKTIVLIIQSFVNKVMSLLFNTVQLCHSLPSRDRVS